MAADQLWGKPVRRVLAIAREHIGDIVNTTPYLRALQDRFPHAELTVDVGKSAAPVLEHFPGLSHLWIREQHEGLGGKLRFVRKIRHERFDLAVIFDDSSRFILECYLAGVPIRVGIHRKRFAKLFTKKIEYSRIRHDVFDPFDDLMGLLEAPIREPRPRLYPGAHDVATAQQWVESITEAGKGIVGLNPSTVRPYNRWRPERWAELADRFAESGYRCVLLGTSADAKMSRSISEMARSKPVDGSGDLTILQLYEACRHFRLLVSVDTGTAHLAGAVDTPVVVLYGVTEPHRFRPFGERFAAARSADKSLESLSTEEVFEAGMKLMG